LCNDKTKSYTPNDTKSFFFLSYPKEVNVLLENVFEKEDSGTGMTLDAAPNVWLQLRENYIKNAVIHSFSRVFKCFQVLRCPVYFILPFF